MTPFEIPLSASAQKLAVTLVNVQYEMTVTWCDPAQCWLLSIADANNNPIVNGIPLVTGANLLEQFDYLNLGFALVVQTDHNTDAVPTYANLGTNGHLYALVP